MKIVLNTLNCREEAFCGIEMVIELERWADSSLHQMIILKIGASTLSDIAQSPSVSNRPVTIGLAHGHRPVGIVRHVSLIHVS